LRAWHAVATGDTDVPEKYVAPSTDVTVDARSYRFPGPKGHPAPTVSNCRTDQPGIPVIGLPDCVRPATLPEGYGATIRMLREAGVPVPDNYSFPSYTGAQESLTTHLQVLQIGEVLLAGCPCEPITDMTANFKTRTDRVEGNQFLGYEWPCREGEEAGVECDFRSASWQPEDWRPVDAQAHARMRAQVRNDAAGWEDDPEQLFGEAEPADPAEIRGNFTHDELDAEDGFTLPLMVGTANDYVGYVVTYREYQRGDHYRKALTPFGPRTADYINTRLVAMAAALRGGPSPQGAVDLAAETFDDLKQSGKVRVFGSGAAAASAAYGEAIPDDGGEPGRVLAQPDAVVERFGAATLTWEGGSNYTDNPTVVVERLVEDRDPPGRPTARPSPATTPGGAPTVPPGRPDDPPGPPDDRPPASVTGWETVATMEGGEVVVTLAYESWTSEAPLQWLTGGKTYEWTATFEVPEGIAPGTYRFVVEGHHRRDREAQPYTVASDPFTVDVWRGITVHDLDVAGGRARFGVAGVERDLDPGTGPGPVEIAATAIRYPFTYETDVPFVDASVETHAGSDGEAHHRYCFRCTLRPWATHGEVVAAAVTVHRADGTTTTHEATYDPDVDRWVTGDLGLGAGDTVTVEPGQVVDELGNTNGERTEAGP
jgi:hypothetical protein